MTLLIYNIIIFKFQFITILNKYQWDNNFIKMILFVIYLIMNMIYYHINVIVVQIIIIIL